MTARDRRSALAALAAASGACLLGLPNALAARTTAVSFPDGPALLRRTLKRELGGGEALTILREWQVSFQPQDAGAAVTGHQQRCEVDAPPELSALARIERERVVTGLFPLHLGHDGLIADWADSAPKGIAPAVEEASRSISRAAMKQTSKKDAARYFAEIGRTAAELVSQVPRDLFYPEIGRSTKTRKLDLSGGLVGTYEVTVSATARPRDGLLDSSERRIVTRIGDSARVASERWTLLI